MKNLKEAIRVKEEQVRVLMEQIDKLRAAVAILEEEENPLGMVVEVEQATAHGGKHAEPARDNAPAQKRAWP
jgi:hypothetical protein